MTAITVADLDNAKLDVEHIEDIATSPLPTATDRMGNTKATVAGKLDQIDEEFLGATGAISFIYQQPSPTDPLTRPDGSPRQAGDVYFNSALNLNKRFNGTVWVASDLTTANLGGPSGSSLVGFTRAGASADAVRTVEQELLEQDVLVTDFMTAAERTDAASGNPTIGTSDRLAAAIADAVARGMERVRLPRYHLMEKTVVVPVGVTVVGCGFAGKTFLKSAGVWTQGFAFLFNTTDGLAPTVPFPNLPCGGIEAVSFENQNQAQTVRAFGGYGSFRAENLRGRYMAQMVKRLSGGYSDHVEVRRVFCAPVTGADYQVDLAGIGDSCVVAQCHFPFNAANPGSGTPNAVQFARVFGGAIQDCIGGNIRVVNSTLRIEGGHHERAQLIVAASNVDVTGTVFYPTTGIPIVFDNNAEAQSYECSLTNVETVYMEGNFEWTGADVSVGSRFNVSIRNCRRKWTQGSSVDKMQTHGLRLVDGANNPLPDWNNNAHVLSRLGEVMVGGRVPLQYSLDPTSVSFNGLTAAPDNAVKWGIATGTYFYTSRLWLDFARRVGRAQFSPETSIALTSSAGGARLDVDYAGRNPYGMLRVYRGTAAGSYDSYADIPVLSTRSLYDNGNRLNGVPWTAQAAGAADAVNGLGEQFYEARGALVRIIAAAAPTVGAWQQGDALERPAPAAAGKRGRICVTSGIPGTWKDWGPIDA